MSMYSRIASESFWLYALALTRVCLQFSLSIDAYIDVDAWNSFDVFWFAVPGTRKPTIENFKFFCKICIPKRAKYCLVMCGRTLREFAIFKCCVCSCDCDCVCACANLTMPRYHVLYIVESIILWH